MENDKPGSDGPWSPDVGAPEDGNEAYAKSVTDLIDNIERSAFKRYVSMREHHHEYGWSSETRLEH